MRRRLFAFSVLVLGLLLSGLVSLRPADAAPGEPQVPIGNPDLPIGCGLDVNVVLDESGSVKDYKRDVQTAFRAFTAALKNTGSRMAVDEFSTVARLPLAAPATSEYTVITNATIASTFEPYIASQYNPNGSTNWEDGLRVSRYMLPRPSTTLPHLVVFITDGNPNQMVREDRVTYDPGNPSVAANEYENKVPLADNEVQDADEDDSADRAAANANGIKAMGSHILALAVGDGLSSQSSLNRLKQISGPDVFDGTGTFDISTTDVYREADFSQLGEALEAAAFQLCAPSVTVRKLVDYTPNNGPEDAVPGASFELTGVASPTPGNWVLPPSATGDTAVTDTDGNGFATFQWTYDTPTDSQLTVTEEDPSDVIPGLVFEPSATSCSYRTPDVGDTPLPTTPVNRGFSADIPRDAIVTCTILNKVAPDPSITLKKYTNFADADAAPGPSIPTGTPVTWSYVLQNTGNTTLTGIEVADDQGVMVTCPEDTLAPDEGMICTATGTAVAGQYANIGTVTATDTYGTAVTASDPSHYVGTVPGIGIQKTTNGQDADFPTGPFVPVGGDVTWAYTVTNTGTSDLTNVVVTDDQVGAVTCPQTALSVGESMDCTDMTGTAVAGQYENVATTTATGPGDVQVAASDPSHYYGTDPGIRLIKATNRQDADDPTGPMIPVDDPVQWTYYITNTGNVPITRYAVEDSDPNVDIKCLLPPQIPQIRVGQTVVCTAIGTAVEGQYANTATVTGTTPLGDVTDDNPSHYFGTRSSIDVEKATNTFDADNPPGPIVAVGSQITWDYQVTNTGNTPLTQLVLEDSVEGTVGSCPASLAPGASTTCTLTGTAGAGLYDNTVIATAVDPFGLPVSDLDPSHYFGKVSDIDVEKSTNGVDADDAPGPYIKVGDPVTWSYQVTNLGNTALRAIQVTDDLEGDVTCPGTVLDAGESMTCTPKTGVAEAGQYENLVTATGITPIQDPVSDEDPSHYFGYTSSVTLTKSTNGEDANDPTGPYVPVGSTVTWTYVVTNTGTIPIISYTVTDSDPAVEVSCPNLSPLPPGASVTCSAAGTAVAGQYANTGTVDAIDSLEDPLTDTDPSHYFGASPDVDIEKSTNGEDADAAPGPNVPTGSTVTWEYQVTNTGNAPLTNVAVTDDKLGAISCPQTTLAVEATFTCTATGQAEAGQYANLGTVTALFEPPGSTSITVTDSDPSHYFGATPAVDIEKSTNGEDADAAPGPTLPNGSTVTWAYVITNTGNTPLTQIAVTDDKLGAITCPKTTLKAGATFTCEATGEAQTGQYANLGTVNALFEPPASTARSGVRAQAFPAVTVTDSDPSHYTGSAPNVPPTQPDIGAPDAGNPDLADTGAAGIRAVLLTGLLLLLTGTGIIGLARRSAH